MYIVSCFPVLHGKLLYLLHIYVHVYLGFSYSGFQQSYIRNTCTYVESGTDPGIFEREGGPSLKCVIF